jgi:hypothetical protein
MPLSFGFGKGSIFKSPAASATPVFAGVTSSLALWLDPSNSSCYSGSGTTLTDLSGNGLTCTLTSGATVSGGHIVLDGINDTVNTNSNVDLRRNWTLECWVRPNISTNFSFFGHGSSPTSSGLHLLWQPSGARTFLFGMMSNDVSKNMTSNSFPANVWYHVVITYNHTTFAKKAYVNGVDAGLNPEQTQAAYIAAPNILRFGAYYSSGPAAYGNGKFGQLRYYTQALSAADVLVNYNATKATFGL